MPGNKSKARERERKEEEAARDYRARDFLGWSSFAVLFRCLLDFFQFVCVFFKFIRAL